MAVHKGEDVQEGVPGGDGFQLTFHGAPQYILKFYKQLIFHLGKHIIDITVVQVECSPVDVGQVSQFLDRYIFYIFFFHQLQQALQQKGFRLPHPSVHLFFFHHKSSISTESMPGA